MNALSRYRSISVLVALLVAFVVWSPGCAAHSKRPVPPAVTGAVAPSDPLPSWNDGAARRALIDFVARVSDGGNEEVPIEERVAVFDNDGTLWQEKPVAEGAFTLARLSELAKTE